MNPVGLVPVALLEQKKVRAQSGIELEEALPRPVRVVLALQDTFIIVKLAQ